ncbi:MAG: rhomboid family intramembrane serine protease [Armatimonadota bacterium]
MTIAVLVALLLRTHSRPSTTRPAGRSIPWATAVLVLLLLFGFLQARSPALALTSLPPAARWFVSPCLHADPFHLATNLMALIGLGLNSETRVGWIRMVVIFALGAVLGNAIAQIFSPSDPVLGASGGVYAAMTFQALRFDTPGLRVPVFIVLVVQAACALAIPHHGTAFLAHVVGGAVGALASLLPVFSAPLDREATIASAHALLARERPALAAAMLRRHLEACPRDVSAQLLFAEALHRTGDDMGARRAGRATIALGLSIDDGFAWVPDLPDPVNGSWTVGLAVETGTRVAELMRRFSLHRRAAVWLEAAWRSEPTSETGLAAGISAARILWRDCSMPGDALALLRELEGGAPDGAMKDHIIAMADALVRNSAPNAQP